MSRVTQTPPLARLLCWEAVTSLGESAMETALLLRAGLSNVEASHFIDAQGRRVMLSAAPSLPSDLGGENRMVALASHALLGLMKKLDPQGQLGSRRRPLQVLLALPERFSTSETNSALTSEGRYFLKALRATLPPILSEIEFEVFPFGRAAGAVALQRALQLVDADRIVIWGGVDTLHEWSVLEALEATDRLLTQDNIDGIRPSEGAAFAAIGPSHAAGDVEVLALGLGREPHPIGSDQPCLSVGLSLALEAALAPLRATQSRSNCWLLDNSHEVYATQELQNIIARFGDALGLQAQLQMPLKELGDVGAAAMPLLAVLGAEAWRLGFANDDTAVVTGCSDSGARGAMLLASSTDTFQRATGT